jgi:hypothetical protein
MTLLHNDDDYNNDVDVDLDVIYDIGTADDGGKPRQIKSRYHMLTYSARARMGGGEQGVEGGSRAHSLVLLFGRAVMLCTML